MNSSLPGSVLSSITSARPLWMILSVVIADLIGLMLSVGIAIGIRLLTGGTFSMWQIAALWPLPVLLLMFFSGSRLYAVMPLHPAEELRRMSYAISLAFIILVMATFFLRTGDLYSRTTIIGAWLMSLIAVPISRAVLRQFASRLRWWGVPVVVLGAGKTACEVISCLQRWPSRGLRPLLILDDDQVKHRKDILGLPVLGPIDDLAPVCSRAGISRIMLAMPGTSPERLRQLWHRLGPQFPTVLIAPGLSDFASLWVEAKDVGGVLALELQQSLLRPERRALKRTLDLIMILLGAVFFLPLVVCLMILIKLTSAGPVFYGQPRLGRGEREFIAWKFRTMHQNADAMLAEVLASDPDARAEWERDHKLRQDPRVTWIGRILRKTSLDELPQLWNIICGDMSLVGPRPVTRAEMAKYGDQWAIYTRVRPGLTGHWQVSGRNQTTYDQRVALDTFYVHNWSPWFDLVILARTVQTVLRGEGAY